MTKTTATDHRPLTEQCDEVLEFIDRIIAGENVTMTTTIAERYDAGTNDEYHAGDGVSNSRLSVFREDPALYHARFIAKTLPPPPSSEAFDIGTALHELVLFGEFESCIVCPFDKLDRRKKEHKEWAESTDGGIVLSQSDVSDLREMRDALYEHRAARRLLFDAPGDCEVPLRMTCPESGLLTRCKIDRLSESFCVDLKTTRDPSPKAFATAAANYGYHRQQAFYSRLASSYIGQEIPFYFVSIGKRKPYRVEVYKLEPEFVVEGSIERDFLLGRIAECHESGVWRFPHYGDVLSLPMPNWTKYNNNWETE